MNENYVHTGIYEKNVTISQVKTSCVRGETKHSSGENLF